MLLYGKEHIPILTSKSGNFYRTVVIFNYKSYSVTGNAGIILSVGRDFALNKKSLQKLRKMHAEISNLLCVNGKFLQKNDPHLLNVEKSYFDAKKEYLYQLSRKSKWNETPFVWRNGTIGDSSVNGKEKRKKYIAEFIRLFFKGETLSEEKTENPCKDVIRENEFLTFFPPPYKESMWCFAPGTYMLHNPRGLFLTISRDANRLYMVGIIYGESRAEAALATAYFRMNFQRGGGEKSINESIASLKRSDFKIGDICFSNKGRLTADLKTVKGTDEYAIYFIRGNTSVAVVDYSQTESVLATAKRIDARLQEIEAEARAKAEKK